VIPKQKRPPEQRVIKKRKNKFPMRKEPRNKIKQELQEKFQIST
jgi:hypothetical protein